MAASAEREGEKETHLQQELADPQAISAAIVVRDPLGQSLERLFY